MFALFIICKGNDNVRVIILSDSHGNYRNVRKIAENEPKAEIFVHLGDGENDFNRLRQDFPSLDIRFVRGNNDYMSGAPFSIVVDVPGARIFCAHGNRHSVYSGTEIIGKIAKNLECNIACFGHTHRYYYNYEDGIFFLNPGSSALPRDSMTPSYAFIDITPAGIIIGKKDLLI
jgi:putative phosphoesterase